MPWSLSDLQKRKKDLQKSRFFLIEGEDLFLLKESFSSLKEAFSKDAPLRWMTHHCDEKNLSYLLGSLNSRSLFEEEKVVVLKNAESLKEKDLEALLDFSSTIPSYMRLVMVASRIDKRKKSVKELTKKALFIKLDPPYENKLPLWVKYMCRKLALSVGSKETLLICEKAGPQLISIYNELLKLKGYLGERKEVRAQDILECFSHSQKENVFRLMDFVGKKDISWSLSFLKELRQNSQASFQILGLLVRHFRLLLLLKEEARKKTPFPHLSQKVGVSPFFLKNYMNQLPFWTGEEIYEAIEELYRLDSLLKSTQNLDEVLWERAILRICKRPSTAFQSVNFS